MTAAFTFPGQGSQSVGMGKALADAFPAARAVFDEVDAALGQKLSAVMWDGPIETLTLTENAQPALMAVSLATIRVLEAEAGLDLARDAAFVAGHSLGEYSALAAAGTFSIADTARLLRIRGNAMQAATPVGTGAMAAILGLDFEAVVAVAAEAAEGEVCQAANDNGGGQVVISGHKAGRQARDSLARLRPLPLRPDAAGRRRHGRGPGEGQRESAGRARRRQRRRRPRQRSRGDRPPSRRAGHRHGALARMRRRHGRGGCHHLLRDRLRQGADRPRQAHCRRRHRNRAFKAARG